MRANLRRVESGEWMELNEELTLGFAGEHIPSGHDLEVAARREHVAFSDPVDLLELRRAVQLCSVGLGEMAIPARGVQTPACAVVAEHDLEAFVERRIRGWAGLN
jgi:hypothetical protein